MAGEGGEEGRVGAVEPIEKPQRRRLRDRQIGVTGILFRAMRRNVDRGGKPCCNQIEEHLGLVRPDRKRGRIGADQRGRGFADVFAIEKRMGQCHRQIVDLAAPDHVTEVDVPVTSGAASATSRLLSLAS